MTNQTNSISARIAQLNASKTTSTPSRPVRKATPGQVKFLTDLRERFNIPTEDITSLTAKQTYDEIQELTSRPAPASKKQMEIIAQTMVELSNAGMKINISQEKLSTLTGGREGTASKMIEFLFTKRNELNISAPMSDAQAETIANWYFCPDISFESISTEVVYPLKEGANVAECKTEVFSIDTKVALPDISATAWRAMTREEFIVELKSKFNQSSASKFIDANRDAYYQWKQTRATSNQKTYIRNLDERLARIYTSKEVNFAVDAEGNVIEVDVAPASDRMPTRAHEPLTDAQLDMFSYDEASQLIDQMRAELNNTGDYAPDSQEAVHEKMDEFTNKRTTSALDAMSKELVTLQDLIYKLEAIVGSESPELHAMANETFVLQKHTPDVLIDTLKDFMRLAIDDSNDARLMKSYGMLSVACQDSEIAMKAVSSL